MNKHKKNTKIQPSIVGVNVLGVAGYMLGLTAWVLLAAVIVALLVERSIVVLPEVITDTPPQSVSSPVSNLTIGIASVVTAIVVLVTLVVFIILPYLVGKWSSRALRRLLLLAKIPPTKRHMFLAKGIVVSVPLLGFLVVAMTVRDTTMTFAVIYSATVVASVLAIVFFFAQLLAARALRIPDEKVW